MGVPNQLPSLSNMAEQIYAQFLMAKDIDDRSPGRSKKKWPVVVAVILLVLLVAVFTVLIFHSRGIL